MAVVSDCDQVITSGLKFRVADDEYGKNKHRKHKPKDKHHSEDKGHTKHTTKKNSTKSFNMELRDEKKRAMRTRVAMV